LKGCGHERAQCPHLGLRPLLRLPARVGQATPSPWAGFASIPVMAGHVHTTNRGNNHVRLPRFSGGELPVARGVGVDGRRCGLGCQRGPVGGLVLVGAAPAEPPLEAVGVVQPSMKRNSARSASSRVRKLACGVGGGGRDGRREGPDGGSELARMHPFGPRVWGPHDGESGPGLLSQVSGRVAGSCETRARPVLAFSGAGAASSWDRM
jgi:hypothetical protein